MTLLATKTCTITPQLVGVIDTREKNPPDNAKDQPLALKFEYETKPLSNPHRFRQEKGKRSPYGFFSKIQHHNHQVAAHMLQSENSASIDQDHLRYPSLKRSLTAPPTLMYSLTQGGQGRQCGEDTREEDG